MSSKQSILLGTDGPDGSGPGSEVRFLTPSARVLEVAAQATNQALTPLQAAAFETETNDASTSQTYSDNDVGFTAAAAPVAATAPAASSRPKSAWQPRPLPQPTTDAPVVSAPRGVRAELAADMTSLSTAFADALSRHAASEAEEKALEHSVRRVAKGALAGTTDIDSIGAAPDAAAMATCFDLVTSTAARVPLARIIAASGPDAMTGMGSLPSAAAAAAAAAHGDTYVVIQPVDWRRHDAECTFARLTGVNRGADASEAIALELASEAEELRTQVETLTQQIASKDRVIDAQRRDIKHLQAQLDEARRAAAQTPGVTATPATAPTALAAAATTAPKAVKVHDSDSDSANDSDASSSSDEDDMADAEDGNFGAAPSSS